MATSEQLKKVIRRRHPRYDELSAHWEFLEATYDGGRDWFDINLFRYMKEGAKEFADRKTRAYRFNHTREVVDLVTKYLFRAPVVRSGDAPKSVQKFWEKATLSGLSMQEFARVVSTKSSILGRPWIVVDNNATDLGADASKDEAEAVRCYAYLVSPIDILDMSFDDEGELNWILIREKYRDDEDPFGTGEKEQFRYRLWDRHSWTLITVDNAGNYSDEIGTHDLGVVPVIQADHVFSDDQWSSTAMIADIAYLDRAIANYLSNLDAIIQDQTFSQLIMPAQGLLPGDDGYKKLVDSGTNRIFTYDSQANGKPEFISPDVKQSELILQVVTQIINEIYHSVGLAGEHTKQDNSQGIDNSSGVAKSKDFERVLALLQSKADAMERIENRVAALVAKWSGEESKLGEEKRLVAYTDHFDVRSLSDELGIALQLSVIEAPKSIREQQMLGLVEKLFPNLSDDLIKSIKGEVKAWAKEREEIGSLALSPEKNGALGEAKRDRDDAGSKQSKTKSRETGSKKLSSRETGKE